MKPSIYRLLASFFLMTVSSLAWAWEGQGTSANPYLIQNTDDWAQLAKNVDEGNSYADAVFRMTRDITITQEHLIGSIAGTNAYAFSGTFDGDGHTLTLNAGSSNETLYRRCAPFLVVAGATIRHLHTDGQIYSDYWDNGGIVGLITGPGTTTLYDCHSAMKIYVCKGAQDSENGGLVGYVMNWHDTNVESVVIERCTFTGKLIANAAQAVKGCAGFIGYISEKIPATLRDCVFDPQYDDGDKIVTDGATFARATTASMLTLERCYATQQMSTKQGTFIFNEMQVPEGVTYEFQEEAPVSLGGNEYWTTGCRVQITVPSGTKFKYWKDSNGCFISDPFTASGIHRLKDLYAKPNLKIYNEDIPTPETLREIDGCKYRYLSRKDYHFYVSDEDCKAQDWKFEGSADDANLVKYDADGDAAEITAIVDWVHKPNTTFDDLTGVWIENDLVGDWRTHTHLGVIAPHAFSGSPALSIASEESTYTLSA